MTSEEKTHAITAHAERHKRAPRAGPATVVLPTPPSLAGAPPAIVKLAGDLFGSVRSYVKTVLDTEMGRQQDELRGLAESMERRIAVLEAIPVPKSADSELVVTSMRTDVTCVPVRSINHSGQKLFREYHGTLPPASAGQQARHVGTFHGRRDPRTDRERVRCCAPTISSCTTRPNAATSTR
jgi:hypothetical protein